MKHLSRLTLWCVLSITTMSADIDYDLSKMSLREKVGQLFMVGTYGPEYGQYPGILEELILKYGVGGIIAMEDSVAHHITSISRYQDLSKIPLLIGMDAECGPSMRMKGLIRFPNNMTLGAIQHDDILYALGIELAWQCKLLGVHINFAPVVDVNNNPKNPIINHRSFGEDKFNVARKGIWVMKGMQDHGVIACAKHFPGHGDTETDSHLSLPRVSHTRERLDEIELFPFRAMMKEDVGAIMTAHLCVPVFDNLPSSLSRNVVENLLREEMGYTGLIITDALPMKAITNTYRLPQACLKAFTAGNDILLICDDVPINRYGVDEIGHAITLIEQAVLSGSVPEAILDEHVARILAAKSFVKESYKTSLVPVSLDAFNTKHAFDLKQELFNRAITVVKNDKHTLPLPSKRNKRVGFVQIGGPERSLFHHLVSQYCPLSSYIISPRCAYGSFSALLNSLKVLNVDTIVVGLFDMQNPSQNSWGISSNALRFVHDLARLKKRVVLVLFGNPYSLELFGDEDAIVVAYEDALEAQCAAARVVCGTLDPQGLLPVTASNQFPAGFGFVSK